MATTLEQWEVGPFNAGVNISTIASEIDDNEAAIIQDMLLDVPGTIYTRGPIRNVVQNTPTLNGSGKKIKGLFSTTAPDGTTHLATVTQTIGGVGLQFTTLSDTGNAIGVSLTLDSTFPTTSDCAVDAKPALGGGAWIGTQELAATPNLAGRQCLFHWRGSVSAAYSTGTLTATSGSTAVVGVGTTWVGNVTPGMFLLSPTGTFVAGVVKTVNSNTSITLEAPSTANIGGGAYLLNPIRAFGLEISRGRISVASGSASVIGSGTKFLSTPLDGAWTLYRARDNATIGVPLTMQGEEGLTLTGGASIVMDAEPYVARRFTNTYTTYLLADATPQFFPGVLNTTYAGLQWFARQDLPTHVGNGDGHSRVWFSDYRNMNSLDLVTTDGDFINVPSTVGQNRPITAIAGTTNTLLIFKDNETFAVTGDSPSTFTLTKLFDDGCLSPMSVVQYHGSIIWAGRNGIYIFDGTTITNLVLRSLGKAWKDYVAAFDSRVHRLTAALHRDTFILKTSAFPSQPYVVLKNSVTYQHFSAFAIYLPTKALSFLTGMDLNGYATTSTTTLFATTNQYICDFANVFTSSGGSRDFPDQGSPTWFGPDPVYESKWFSMKDPLRKKMFKQILATFTAYNQNLLLEVAPGLKTSDTPAIWSLIVNPFVFTFGDIPVTSRLKFLKRDRQMRIKLYQDTSVIFGQFSLRRFAIGFKSQKVGRL